MSIFGVAGLDFLRFPKVKKLCIPTIYLESSFFFTTQKQALLSFACHMTDYKNIRMSDVIATVSYPAFFLCDLDHKRRDRFCAFMTQDPILRGYSSMTGCHLYYTPPKWGVPIHGNTPSAAEKGRAMEKGGLRINKSENVRSKLGIRWLEVIRMWVCHDVPLFGESSPGILSGICPKILGNNTMATSQPSLS